MKKQDSGILLLASIKAKEAEHQVVEKLLKEHLHLTYENLKPVNIIKNTFKEIITLLDLKTDFVNRVIGICTVFVAKKQFIGKPHNLLLKLSGVFLEMMLVNKVSNNFNEIKAVGNVILKKIIHKKRKPQNNQVNEIF